MANYHQSRHHRISLSTRIVSVILATFVPITVLVVVLAGVVIRQVRADAEAQYEQQSQDIEAEFNRATKQVEDNLTDFVQTYLTELTLPEACDELKRLRMTKALGDIFDNTMLTGIAYLYDKQDGQLNLRHTPGLYKPDWLETAKLGLLRDNLPNIHEWQDVQIAGSPFAYIQYDYTNFTVGIAVDTSKKHSSLAGLRMSVERYRRLPNAYIVMLVVAGASLALVGFIWWLFKRHIVASVEVLRNGMKQLQDGHMDYRITAGKRDDEAEFEYLYERFNRMAEEIGQARDREVEMYQTQLDNLRLQVNPHMLLNSFNMIYSLAQMQDYPRIQEYSLLLSDYFRYCLGATDRFVPLQKEIEFVGNFTEIQKLRFPGAFTYVYSIGEDIDTDEVMILPLIIENFIENAMKYALIPGKTIEVMLNIRKEDDRLLVSICDTGKGIKAEALTSITAGEVYVDKSGGKHIGIWNCRRRLEAFYGGTAALRITSSPGGGTQVWMELPI